MVWHSSVSSASIPVRRAHQLDRLLGADPARRALAAALVLEEAHQVERHVLHVVLVAEDHDRGRADEAAVFLQRAEIQRQVVHATRAGCRRTRRRADRP